MAMFRLSRPLIKISSIVSLTIFSGCAASSNHGTDPLALDSILDVKSRREQLVAQTPVESKKETSVSIPLQPSPEPQVKEIVVALLPEMPPPHMDPEELKALYPLPEGWTLLGENDADYKNLKGHIEKALPVISAIWKNKSSDISMAAGKVPLKAESMLALDEKGLMLELDKLADQYKVYYSTVYQAQAETEVKKRRNIYMVKLQCNYSMNGFGWIDQRYIYFYKPEYRLTLIVSGRDKVFQNQEIPLARRIEAFTSELEKTGGIILAPSKEQKSQQAST